MKQPQSDNHSYNAACTTIAGMAIVVLFFLFSCNDSKKHFTPAIESPDSLSIISSYGVTTLISDSGRISYKIIAEEWLMFEKRNPPCWTFEKGAYLEKYDDSLRVEMTLRSDTAYYFSKDEVWQLKGNVRITNNKGERFFTDMLFWDQDSSCIYSDSYIRIEQKDQITEGRGFSATQNLSSWQILNTEGIFPIEE
ncbi:MAG: LPS export ABC transporter periplasmic protein LptC [Bacteroidaceae bacterium]|nr:LPS export ABC transporter periplasmic protein LptC [Bacteroidaceae bacterium]